MLLPTIHPSSEGRIYETKYGLGAGIAVLHRGHSRNNEIIDIFSIEIKGYTTDEIWHHLLFMQSGRLIIADREFHGALAVCKSPTSLSWQGYEYLDKIRDPGRWEKIKLKLQPIGDFSYTAVKEAVSELAIEQFKRYIPLAIYSAFVYLAGLFSQFFR